MSKPYWENLPEDGNFTEDDLWDAIAESLGMDSSEILTKTSWTTSDDGTSRVLLPDGEWWIVHDPYNGNDGYELIPCRRGIRVVTALKVSSLLFAAQGVAADIMEGSRLLVR